MLFTGSKINVSGINKANYVNLFMIGNSATYLYFMLHRPLIGVIAILCCCFSATAQSKPPAKDSSNTQSRLFYYHSFTSSKLTRPYTKIDYTRPNNQVMSWPNFPLTATEIERRHRVAEQESKVSSVIAKDIITNMLKKKTKVAVIPRF
jgi:hypothetical protein